MTACVGLAALMLLPALLGYERYVIVSGSMTGTIDTGSIVYAKPVPTAGLKAGDIITYAPPAGASPTELVTHRIDSITAGPRGERVFRTKGDHNASVDPWTFTLTAPTQAQEQFHVPFIGYAFAALSIREVRMAVIGGPAMIIALLTIVGPVPRRPPHRGRPRRSARPRRRPAGGPRRRRSGDLELLTTRCRSAPTSASSWPSPRSARCWSSVRPRRVPSTPPPPPTAPTPSRPPPTGSRRPCHRHQPRDPAAGRDHGVEQRDRRRTLGRRLGHDPALARRRRHLDVTCARTHVARTRAPGRRPRSRTVATTSARSRSTSPATSAPRRPSPIASSTTPPPPRLDDPGAGDPRHRHADAVEHRCGVRGRDRPLRALARRRHDMDHDLHRRCAPFSCSFATTTAATPNGDYDLRITVTDAAGNVAATSHRRRHHRQHRPDRDDDRPGLPDPRRRRPRRDRGRRRQRGRAP